MGMFEKDKQFAKDGIFHGKKGQFDVGDKGIMWDAQVVTEDFALSDSKTVPMAWVQISPVDAPENVLVVSTIGTADVRKIRENDGTDLPCIVEVIQVPSSDPEMQDAVTFRYVENYDGAFPKGTPTLTDLVGASA